MSAALLTLQPRVNVLVSVARRLSCTRPDLDVDGATSVNDMTYMFSHVDATDRTLVVVSKYTHTHTHTHTKKCWNWHKYAWWRLCAQKL